MNLSDYPDVGKVEDVVLVTRYDRKTIYEAIKRGELSAVRCGRAIRVTRVALLHWLNLDVGPPGHEEEPGDTGPSSKKSEQDSDPTLHPPR
jgi:excisionase family DNA binding protein